MVTDVTNLTQTRRKGKIACEHVAGLAIDYSGVKAND